MLTINILRVIKQHVFSLSFKSPESKYFILNFLKFKNLPTSDFFKGTSFADESSNYQLAVVMACIQADFHAVCFIFIRKKGADAQFDPSLLGYITWQQVRPPIRLKVIPFPPLSFPCT